MCHPVGLYLIEAKVCRRRRGVLGRVRILPLLLAVRSCDAFYLLAEGIIPLKNVKPFFRGMNMVVSLTLNLPVPWDFSPPPRHWSRSDRPSGDPEPPRPIWPKASASKTSGAPTTFPFLLLWAARNTFVFVDHIKCH